jgi:hypothetical protein
MIVVDIFKKIFNFESFEYNTQSDYDEALLYLHSINNKPRKIDNNYLLIKCRNNNLFQILFFRSYFTALLSRFSVTPKSTCKLKRINNETILICKIVPNFFTKVFLTFTTIFSILLFLLFLLALLNFYNNLYYATFAILALVFIYIFLKFIDFSLNINGAEREIIRTFIYGIFLKDKHDISKWTEGGQAPFNE